MCHPGIDRPFGEIWPVCPNEAPSIVYCAEAIAERNNHDTVLYKKFDRMMDNGDTRIASILAAGCAYEKGSREYSTWLTRDGVASEEKVFALFVTSASQQLSPSS